MADVSVYLNLPGTTEEAFNFYKSVFGGEFTDGIHRMSEVPPQEGQNPLSDADKNLVMHVELKILNGFRLMGTDAVESAGHKVVKGNTTYINLLLDTKADVDAKFAALSAGGIVEMQPQDMFWGDYFASFQDKFGICWMLVAPSKS